MSYNIIMLIAGVFVALVFASLAGWIISVKNKDPYKKDVITNLNERIVSWWVMIFIVSFSFLSGTTATLILFAVISFFTLREFISLLSTHPEDHRMVAIAFYLMIPLQYYFIGINWQSMLTILIPVWCFLFLPVFSLVKGKTEDFMERTATVQWALMLCVCCISHAPALLNLKIPGFEGKNIGLMFFLIIVVQLSDVMQYIVGKIWGRRKVAVKISPSKTWEGLVGGGLLATIAGGLLWWITPFSPLQATLLSFSIVVSGFLGGLLLSAIKRSFGTKNWGTMIRGHGGMLDRVDSISFAAPVFYHLVRFYWT